MSRQRDRERVLTRDREGVLTMAKRFGRPSLHYRYEHYDPR